MILRTNIGLSPIKITHFTLKQFNATTPNKQQYGTSLGTPYIFYAKFPLPTNHWYEKNGKSTKDEPKE